MRVLEERMEDKFLDYDSKINDIQNKIDFFVRSSLPPVEGIFYDGQIFDAYAHIVSLIKQARSAVCQRSHDRFLIVDDLVYIFGASLKDAGKKLFAYIKMQETSPADLLSNIR